MTGGEKLGGDCGGALCPGLFQLYFIQLSKTASHGHLPFPLHSTGSAKSLGDSHSNQSPVPQHPMLHPHLTPCCLTAALLLRACHSHEAGSLTHDRASPPCRGWESLYSLAHLPPSLSHFLWLTSSHSAHGFFSFNHFGQNK